MGDVYQIISSSASCSISWGPDDRGQMSDDGSQMSEVGVGDSSASSVTWWFQVQVAEFTLIIISAAFVCEHIGAVQCLMNNTFIIYQTKVPKGAMSKGLMT